MSIRTSVITTTSVPATQMSRSWDLQTVYSVTGARTATGSGPEAAPRIRVRLHLDAYTRSQSHFVAELWTPAGWVEVHRILASDPVIGTNPQQAVIAAALLDVALRIAVVPA